MVLYCEKFDTFHGKAVNALHQRTNGKKPEAECFIDTESAEVES